MRTARKSGPQKSAASVRLSVLPRQLLNPMLPLHHQRHRLLQPPQPLLFRAGGPDRRMKPLRLLLRLFQRIPQMLVARYQQLRLLHRRHGVLKLRTRPC